MTKTNFFQEYAKQAKPLPDDREGELRERDLAVYERGQWFEEHEAVWASEFDFAAQLANRGTSLYDVMRDFIGFTNDKADVLAGFFLALGYCRTVLDPSCFELTGWDAETLHKDLTKLRQCLRDRDPEKE